LRYWTSRRATAQVVDAPRDANEVRFGSTVTIQRDDGRRSTYRIVGEDEADPSLGTLSYVSPVAQALMGKQVGEVVEAGHSEAEIVAIS
jgi:transcription elongation GreA/GreB family factor